MVDILDMDWLTEDMVEDVEQDVVGISGMRKLAGVFNISGDCGDIGVFDNWFTSVVGCPARHRLTYPSYLDVP